MSISSPPEWDGIERRRGRPVYARGPIILGLEIASAISSALALLAILLAIFTFSGETKRFQRGNYLTCHLIVQILHSFHTPRGRISATFILAANPELRDCHRYAITSR